MTELQKHLMQLVKEIKDTCREQDIPFALFGQTAGRAAKFHEFKNQCSEFHIMVRTKDILKLKKALNAKNIKNRGWDDLSCNPNLPRNNVRYVDLATTVYDKEASVNYDKLGVAVVIHPVYAKQVEKRDRRLEVGTFYLNHGIDYSYYNMPLEIETAQKFRKLFGKKFVGRRIYSIFKRERNAQYGKKVYVHDDEGKLVSIDYTTITDTEEIDFEGMKLPVPKNSKAFFKRLYGDDWKKLSVAPLTSVNRIWAIFDAGKPYEQFLREMLDAGIDIRALQKELRDFKEWKEQILHPATDAANHTYEYARRSVDRIDLHSRYQEKLPQIKKAADEKDMDTLADLMKEYLSLTNYYFEQGIGFFVDQELFGYASMIWESKGHKDYANQVYELVPEIYKKENVGDFIAKYE